MHRILLWVLSLSQSNTQYNPLLSMHFTLGLHVKMHMKISCMCYKFVSLFSTVQELANRSYIYVKESSEESALSGYQCKKKSWKIWGSQTEDECSDTVGKHADKASPPHSYFVLFLGSVVL